MKKLVFLCFILFSLVIFSNGSFFIGDPMPDAPVLAHRGEFSVGVRTIEIINENQLDILNYSSDNPNPKYDRPLTIEVWYPSIIPENRKEFDVYVDEYYVQDAIYVEGRALRNAEAVQGNFPLIIVSHGYPGTRYMMSYLTENLASKGYVVVAIDHTESTVRNQRAFSSTLLNRPLDVLFTIDAIEELSKNPDSFLFNIVDYNNVGLVGYSMGGYGIINAAGAGFSQQGVNLAWGVPGGHLSIRQSGNPEFEKSLDPRIKAIFAMAPWGAGMFWTEETMKGLSTPMFLVAGDNDDVSGYENGIKLFFDRAINSERFMLTFENARHNIANNAYSQHPLISVKMSADDYMRFAEPSWDNRKINNVVQHFATAFFGIYLKNLDFSDYLDLIDYSNDGVWSQANDGSFNDNHNYWLGFPQRTALGMRFYSSDAE